LQIKTKIVSHHTAESKPVKQEVNGTVILPPLVFPVLLVFGSNEEFGNGRKCGEKQQKLKKPKKVFL
jgi:hypothetical protein